MKNYIKAIVLTCDDYKYITNHMIYKYEQLWPKHPFCFRVPYQQEKFITTSNNVEFKKTSSNIKETVLTLLEDLNDEEFIYWCIDDKYPIYLNTYILNSIINCLFNNINSDIDGILFCRSRNMLKSNFLTGYSIKDLDNNIYLERKDYSQIWLHQFIKVKVLRYLFELFPDDIKTPKDMDTYKDLIIKPLDHKLFVTKNNLAIFGESTSRGVITKNCYKSIKKNRLSLPNYKLNVSTNQKIIGDNRYKKILRYIIKKIST